MGNIANRQAAQAQRSADQAQGGLVSAIDLANRAEDVKAERERYAARAEQERLATIRQAAMSMAIQVAAMQAVCAKPETIREEAGKIAKFIEDGAEA